MSPATPTLNRLHRQPNFSGFWSGENGTKVTACQKTSNLRCSRVTWEVEPPFRMPLFVTVCFRYYKNCIRTCRRTAEWGRTFQACLCVVWLCDLFSWHQLPYSPAHFLLFLPWNSWSRSRQDEEGRRGRNMNLIQSEDLHHCWTTQKRTARTEYLEISEVIFELCRGSRS